METTNRYGHSRALRVGVSAALLLALALTVPAAGRGAESPPGVTAGALPLATFGDDTPGKPPAGWRARGGEIGDVYVVRQSPDGQKSLHADARGKSVQIGKDVQLDVHRSPILTWRWRVAALPTGADERRKETGDSAAGVYVVFGGWPIPNTVKYVWSTSLPVGTRTESPFADQTKVVVLESGFAKAGQWVEERVNVLEDYRAFFREDPPKAKGIGILSDSDNTRSRAVADYGPVLALPGAPGLTGTGTPAGAGQSPPAPGR